MSQRYVERVIGRLVTDEGFRKEFARDPLAALRSLCACGGAELTEVEARALAGLDPEKAAALSEAIDPKLQKLCLEASRESTRADDPGEAQER
jgi:hypothetical protein